ncbi:MAG TPA: aminotransferase class V-fold PLP-dependent enzyme [Gemmatales bacterium]|nr:aminotransferase class V-fold PLP-dependent enzyme [Gemmatales bacterium]
MSLSLPIYLDNHATTRTDPRVLEAMLPYFTEHYGNAASKMHVFGQRADEAVKAARTTVARILQAESREIIFTSGATESNNLAIKGVAHEYSKRGKHLITVASEHKAVLDTCAHLERDGWQVTYVPVEPTGLVDLAKLEAAFQQGTVLVSVMLANNEIGVLQPLREIVQLAHRRNIIVHTDATQAVGKVPVDVRELEVDLLSFTAHKLYGPKGIGALFVRKQGGRVRLDPLQDGGGHEQGLRSGTLPVPLIIGFASACELAMAEMGAEAVRLAALRDRLWAGLQCIPDIHLNGVMSPRLPGNLNVSFLGVKGESLLLELREIALSSGSACTTMDSEPSHVLRALGLDDEMADASLRFGLGRFNTAEEIDYTAKRVAEAVEQLRGLLVKESRH